MWGKDLFFYYPNNMIQLIVSQNSNHHTFSGTIVLNLIKLFILFAIKSEFVFNHSGKKKIAIEFWNKKLTLVLISDTQMSKSVVTL